MTRDHHALAVTSRRRTHAHLAREAGLRRPPISTHREAERSGRHRYGLATVRELAKPRVDDRHEGLW